jgi:hypothetical protein
MADAEKARKKQARDADQLMKKQEKQRRKAEKEATEAQRKKRLKWTENMSLQVIEVVKKLKLMQNIGPEWAVVVTDFVLRQKSFNNNKKIEWGSFE